MFLLPFYFLCFAQIKGVSFVNYAVFFHLCAKRAISHKLRLLLSGLYSTIVLQSALVKIWKFLAISRFCALSVFYSVSKIIGIWF